MTAAFGAFLVGCLGLEMKRTGNERFFKMVGGKRNSPKNQGETGIFAEGKAEIKDKGQQN